MDELRDWCRVRTKHCRLIPHETIGSATIAVAYLIFCTLARQCGTRSQTGLCLSFCENVVEKLAPRIRAIPKAIFFRIQCF